MAVPSELPGYRKYNELRDKLLAARCGDDGKYGEFLNDLRSRVESYLKSQTLEDARDDIIQDVLLSVHMSKHTYDASKPFGPWLIAIIRRRLIDRFRVGKRFVAEDIFDYPNIEHPGIAPDDAIALEAALGQLKPMQRSAVIGTEILGYSTAEVADHLSMSHGAFRVMLHRTLKSLRAIMEV